MIKLSTSLVLAAVVGLLFLLLCSCATTTEEERFDREDRRIQAREEFYRQKDSCHREGRTMQIRLRTLGKHTYHDYKSARCR